MTNVSASCLRINLSVSLTTFIIMSFRTFNLVTYYNATSEALVYLLYENCGVEPIFAASRLSEMDDFIRNNKLYVKHIKNEE